MAGQQGGADSGYANGNGSNSFTVDGANATSNYFGEARGRTRVPYVFGEAAIRSHLIATLTSATTPLTLLTLEDSSGAGSASEMTASEEGEAPTSPPMRAVVMRVGVGVVAVAAVTVASSSKTSRCVLHLLRHRL